MSFVWVSKRSGQRTRGGGCIGCVPFGCLPVLVFVGVVVALVL